MLFVSLNLSAAGATNAVPSLAESLYTNYQQINTLSCRIRKTTTGDRKTLRLLSRVYYKRGGFVHIENVSPFKRTIIADGKQLYYYQQGQELGYSQPIDKLAPLWQASLRKVPATPSDHLYRLRNIPEEKLPAEKKDTVVCGYQTTNSYVVLTASTNGQIHRITFYSNKDRSTKTGEYIYSAQKEVIPGCWIPLTQKAEMTINGDVTVKEQSRIMDLSINKPIPAKIFQHEQFMKDIRFTANFADIFR